MDHACSRDHPAVGLVGGTAWIRTVAHPLRAAMLTAATPRTGPPVVIDPVPATAGRAPVASPRAACGARPVPGHPPLRRVAGTHRPLRRVAGTRAAVADHLGAHR